MEITPVNTVLIVISSLIFALAHASSWDYYKVLPTIIAGFAFGYLFVKKGVHTSIILHFAIDYTGILMESVSGGAQIAVGAVFVVSMLILFLIGGIMTYKYARRAFIYLSELYDLYWLRDNSNVGGGGDDGVNRRKGRRSGDYGGNRGKGRRSGDYGRGGGVGWDDAGVGEGGGGSVGRDGGRSDGRNLNNQDDQNCRNNDQRGE